MALHILCSHCNVDINPNDDLCYNCATPVDLDIQGAKDYWEQLNISFNETPVGDYWCDYCPMEFNELPCWKCPYRDRIRRVDQIAKAEMIPLR